MTVIAVRDKVFQSKVSIGKYFLCNRRPLTHSCQTFSKSVKQTKQDISNTQPRISESPRASAFVSLYTPSSELEKSRKHNQQSEKNRIRRPPLTAHNIFTILIIVIIGP